MSGVPIQPRSLGVKMASNTTRKQRRQRGEELEKSSRRTKSIKILAVGNLEEDPKKFIKNSKNL